MTSEKKKQLNILLKRT